MTACAARVLSGAIYSPAGIIIIWPEDVAYCQEQILLDTWGIVGDWGGRPLAPGWPRACGTGKGPQPWAEPVPMWEPSIIVLFLGPCTTAPSPHLLLGKMAETPGGRML